MRRAHALLVPSAYLVRVFAQYGLSAQTVPNIIDLARFQPAMHRPQRTTILIARHLEPLYDHATALRAFALLHQSLPNASLIICGEGPELPRLQQLAESLNIHFATHFAGKTENTAMAAHYHQADLMLNPSLADNMPISVLEAWASGVPVVSTNVGGVPDLIQDQVDGLLVPPGDAAAMAKAMLALLDNSDLAQRLASAGLVRAQRIAGLTSRPCSTPSTAAY
jgi:phenylacetate-CoA ligase